MVETGGTDMLAHAAGTTAAAARAASGSRLASMPRILYGTAWKAERTADLVEQAFEAGFRGVDTAGQRKHYREDLVGLGLARARSKLGLKREDVWIQTKFTSVDGQDTSGFMPYDPTAPIAEQVRSSFAQSLRNFYLPAAELADPKGKAKQADGWSSSSSGTSTPDEGGTGLSAVPEDAYIDSYVLHSPLRTLEQTAEAWSVLEALQQSGKVRQIGLSNCYDPRIWAALRSSMSVVPCTVLQNRWHGSTGHDISILPTLSPVLSPNDFPMNADGTQSQGVRYQPFWTLTGNPKVLDSTPVLSAAVERSWTPEQVLYRYVSQGFGIAGVKVTVLCGSTTKAHMKEAVAAVEQGEDLPEDVMEAIRKEVYGQ